MLTRILICAVAASALVCSQARAGEWLRFSDNFDASTPDVLSWTGDEIFSVTSPPGSVDLIGAGGSHDFLPGNGSYVDLHGSGQLTSSLTFTPSVYVLYFSLAGNQRGSPAQTLNIALADRSFTLSPLASTSDFIGGSTPDTDSPLRLIFKTSTAGKLVFTQNGSSDQQGHLLDNVTLTEAPEPATWVTLILGFGGVGGMMRRRRTSIA